MLDADEFGKAVAIMHINLDPRGLSELFKEIDTSNSGDLDQNEWMRMMERSRKKLVGAHGPKITWEKLCQFVTNVVVDDSGLTQQDAKPLDTGARALQEADDDEELMVRWGDISVGFRRLGVGWPNDIDDRTAKGMYQAVRPPGTGEDWQEDKPIGDFCEQLLGLLTPADTAAEASLFPVSGDSPPEVELWRTGVRRYLWLELMHTTIDDNKIMHGARGKGAEAEAEEKVRKEIAERPFFFTPDDGLRARWDLIQVFVLLVTAIVVPMRVSFDLIDKGWPRFWFAFDVISDLYFYCDILMNFRTAFADEKNEGKLQTSTREIARNYVCGYTKKGMEEEQGRDKGAKKDKRTAVERVVGCITLFPRGWFMIDLVSTLPVNYILYWFTDLPYPWNEDAALDGDGKGGGSLKILKVLRLFRLAKMLRMLRLKSVVDKYQDSEAFIKFLNSIKLIKLFVQLAYMCHFLACFWYMIGEGTTTMLADHTLIHGWVYRQEWGQTGWGTRYITSLFRERSAVAGSIDRGEVLTCCGCLTDSTTDFAMEFAETDWEMIWVSLQHVVYEAFMAYLTGVFAGEVIVGNAAKQKYGEKMGEIREFMRHHDIKRSLRGRVTRCAAHVSSFRSRLETAQN